MYKLAGNLPGHFDSFITTSVFTVAHRAHQASITASDPRHSSACQIVFLRRLMKGVKSDDPNFVFLERSFDLKFCSDTITNFTLDSFIIELEAIDKSTPKFEAF